MIHKRSASAVALLAFFLAILACNTTITDLPQAQDILTPSPYPEPTLDIRADAYEINSGECTILRWDADNIHELYLDEDAVVAHDSREVCPTSTTTYTFEILKLDNTWITREITIKVISGSSDSLNPGDISNYGTLSLNENDSTRSVSITSGGPVDINATLGGSCHGWTTSAPDYRIVYNDSSSYVGTSLWFEFFASNSDDDATLVVYAPDGLFYCNDDRSGLNPGVQFTAPLMFGTYNIWVGSLYEGEFYDGTLYINDEP